MTLNERSKARYWRMVHNHRCPACGDALPSDYYYVYCEGCRKHKATYTTQPRFFKAKLDKGVT